MINDNDILEMFILGYIIAGHTVTDESITWLNKQVEEFMNEWKYGLELGFLAPLMVCLYKVNHTVGSEEYMSYFTQRYEKVWFNHLVNKYKEEFKLPPF